MNVSLKGEEEKIDDVYVDHDALDEDGKYKRQMDARFHNIVRRVMIENRTKGFVCLCLRVPPKKRNLQK